jgi:hypothetical protein
MVGTLFFEHFVENAPARGSSGLLAVSGSDKVISRGFAFALLIILLLTVVPLGTLVGALGFLILALPITLVTPKDGTNCLLVGGIVGDNVHQFVGGDGVLRPNSWTNSLQVVPEMKAMMMSESMILRSLVHCLEKHQI